MFGKWLMKISEKMERKIHKKSEEKAPVDIERNDFKNQENLSATESDSMKSIKLGSYSNNFLKNYDKFLEDVFPGSIPGILMLDDSKILENNDSNDCFLNF
jgi:hypothetical protein